MGCSGPRRQPRRHWGVAVCAAVSVSFLLSACARSTGSPVAASAPNQDAGAGLGPIDWTKDTPLVGGLEVSSVDEANGYLAFKASLPSNASPPASMYVTNPKVPANEPPFPVREVALGAVFQDPKVGPFWLIERESTMSQADLEALAANCDSEHGCEAQVTVVTLVTGTRALAIRGPETTGLIWLEGDLYFNLVGPATFTLDDAMAVASSL